MLFTCLRGLRVQWNSKSEFEFNVHKFLHSVEKLAQSTNFENLLELNQTTLLKQKLFLMTSSNSEQIYKNFGARKVFISMVQIELSKTVGYYSKIGVNHTRKHLKIATTFLWGTLSPYKDYSSLFRWQANLCVLLCNYGIASMKVCCDFYSIYLIVLLMILFCCLSPLQNY
jgi:hypothetical protein